ncbi:MAG: hypothetical protein KIH08_15715 [Candidatus Freyarchaeota archaeon]|nr:hypothetical protein [Candidatus Jordarchaeia archaeon]MBS7270745.1 hypothetical protein [Candidatus Jordarchaeia archaeon]MBS7281398.1 hypothetical protein [Candidatus Jordarchaeia archaeon]
MTKDLTTIQLSKTVRERLKNLGKKGETYDDIIRRLIEIAESGAGRKSPSTNNTSVPQPNSEQQIAEIENLFKDIHEKFRGKFKDWWEEDHEADQLLLSLAQEEEPHENH